MSTNLDQNAPVQPGIVGTYDVANAWRLDSLADEYHVGKEPGVQCIVNSFAN